MTYGEIEFGVVKHITKLFICLASLDLKENIEYFENKEKYKIWLNIHNQAKIENYINKEHE